MQFSPTGLTARPHGPQLSQLSRKDRPSHPSIPRRRAVGPTAQLALIAPQAPLPFPSLPTRPSTTAQAGETAGAEHETGEEKQSNQGLNDSPRQAREEGGSNLKIDRTMEEGRRGLSRGVGVLKVVVAHGTNLAIRDFTSSDPYVVVRLADMSAKTKVINSCLNPVWNEEMTFSIKEPVGVIKFEVFDWDRFKYDDKMGHAFLDLQPVAAAMKLRRALQLTTGETKLRKVAPSADNCLLSDSFVMYADGEVVLDARLRLRNVESGELFVTIKWIEADAK